MEDVLSSPETGISAIPTSRAFTKTLTILEDEDDSVRELPTYISSTRAKLTPIKMAMNSPMEMMPHCSTFKSFCLPLTELESNRLVLPMAEMFEDLVKASPTSAINRTVFHCQGRPTLSVKEYFKRIFKFCGASFESYVMAFLYLKRLEETVEFDSMNIHR